MASVKEGTLSKRYYTNFAGGVNLYLGSRQIQDNESPEATNCDFKGKGGIGNREGYTQLGSVGGTYDDGIYGLTEYHTSSKDYLIKFASDGSNVVLNYSDNGGTTWNAVTGTKFTNAVNMDVVQAVASSTVPLTGADGTLFSFNGTDTMVKFDGASWGAHTGAATLLYGAFFDRRLWGVDPTYRDVLKFSTQTPDATQALDFATNGTSSNKGLINFQPGSGTEIVGLKVFKNALYVFTRDAIYSLQPASTANTFTVTLVTAAVGCISHRSIEVVENDCYFAANDGVYSLGEVGQFTSVRTTNKSTRVQEVFDALSGANKGKLVGKYFNFKYHLFYSLFGTSNDSCLPFDIRYQAWQDWRTISANDATRFTKADGTIQFYFGHPTTGAVYQMYDGTTDDGTAITSTWYSKSFDEALPDQQKDYGDSTFLFGDLGGSVAIAVIFNDSEVTGSGTITQTNPQGGFGRGSFGRYAFGGGGNSITVTSTVNKPQRLNVNKKKFAVQYRVISTGSWRLDAITQTLMVLGHDNFPETDILN